MATFRHVLLVCCAAWLTGCLAQPEVNNAGDPGGDPAETPPQVGESFGAECGVCHGDSVNPAPPRSISGAMETTELPVGAHRSHVGREATWHAPIECASCHKVPATIDAPGHMDDGDNTAELTFGGRAIMGGAAPTFAGASCSNTYCHGSTLTGGTLSAPRWNVVDGAASTCGACHGAPPPAPHPASTDCGSCHPTMQPGAGNVFLDPSRHIDGVVDLATGAGGGGSGACDSCHGSGGVSAPPRDLTGGTARTAPGVGAHRQHLGTSTWRREINCSSCHLVPVAVDSAGHMDGDNVAELRFDALNPVATFTKATATCASTYCHGNGQGSNGNQVWTSQVAMACTSCHAITPRQLARGHREHGGEACNECHADVIGAGTTILAPALHIDGVKNVSISRGGTYDPATRRCTNLACHGSETW